MEAAHTRWASDLTFRELRRGVQAVSDLYVHKRKTHALSDRAADGRGKRAAFIVYYGGLHLILLQAWTAERPAPAAERVWDLGCGPGVVGATIARWSDARALEASDRLGSHLEVAAWTARRLKVKARTRKAALPGVVRQLRGPGILCLGWVLNELSDPHREATVAALLGRLRAGAGLVVFSPLSLRASPWWPQLVRQVRSVRPEVDVDEFRIQADRPPLIADLDRASRLDHSSLGARSLYVPPALSARTAKG